VDGLLGTTQQALQLLLTGNPELWTIVGISFSVSFKAIVFTTPVALVLAFVLAYVDFPGNRLLLSMFNSLLSVPTVVVGLLLYMLLSRQGPLGDLKLLFTQTAMMLAQMVLCFPILVALGHAAMQAADRRAWETARTLSAPPWHAMLTVLYEVRFGLIAAVLTGFGRIISEVGASMMVGGNILGYTRNITTAIALETSKGEFAQGVALGLVLLLLAFLLNFLLGYFQGKGKMTA